MYMDSSTGIDNSLKIDEEIATLENDMRKVINNNNASAFDLKRTEISRQIG